jgi:cardiolipin synthase A/B
MSGAALQHPWFAVGGDRVRLLRDGVVALPAMLEAIRGAEREVLLEMYWLGDDAVGRAFRDALTERASRGVRVRVVYDAVGSYGLPLSFFNPLRAVGGQVEVFHPLGRLLPALRLWEVDQRDHRKLLVVDEHVGFTGGINLTKHWAPLAEGGEAWRDDMIAVEGMAALELRTLFYRTWRHVRRDPLPKDLLPLRKSRRRLVTVLTTQRSRSRSIHAEYVSRINRATRSIDICNAYFLPDRKVQSALFRAATRGVDVRVMVPARGDVPVVQLAQEALYERLLLAGIRVYVLPGPMMHAKTAIIDASFVTIGSYNLDERSRLRNLELNIAVEDGSFGAHVKSFFEQDITRATALDLGTWRQRAWLKQSVERAALAFRRFW